MDTTTNLTLSFPNWFYGILTIGILGGVAYLAVLHWQIREMCKDHPKIKQSLIRISEILLQKKIARDHVYIMSASPMQLTDAGKAAIKESGFDIFYAANKQILLERVKNRNPKTDADLEEACKEIMLSAENTLPSFDLLKSFAYNNGEPIANILFAAAIALRDRLKTEIKITAA